MKHFFKITFTIFIVISVCAVFAACSSRAKGLADIDPNTITKIQVITSMGNPAYGADSKIIADKTDISKFVDTFNSGIVKEKVSDDDVLTGFSSKYLFYSDDKLVGEYQFNTNNTNIVIIDGEYYFVDYGESLDPPFVLYEKSKSSEIVVDYDGNEMDLIRYNGVTYVKSALQEDDRKWLEHYNSLTEDEQQAISYTPDFKEPFKP